MNRLITAVVLLVPGVTPWAAPKVAPDAGAEGPSPAIPVELPVRTELAPTFLCAEHTKELEQLRRQIAELKAKAADIDRLSAAHREHQRRVEQLEGQRREDEARAKDLQQQLEELRTMTEELVAAERKRHQLEQQALARREELQQTKAAIEAALTRLSVGDTNVETTLKSAELVYTGDALKLLQQAREALNHKDLYRARRLLALAVLEAENVR